VIRFGWDWGTVQILRFPIAMISGAVRNRRPPLAGTPRRHTQVPCAVPHRMPLCDGQRFARARGVIIISRETNDCFLGAVQGPLGLGGGQDVLDLGPGQVSDHFDTTPRTLVGAIDHTPADGRRSGVYWCFVAHGGPAFRRWRLFLFFGTPCAMLTPDGRFIAPGHWHADLLDGSGTQPLILVQKT